MSSISPVPSTIETQTTIIHIAYDSRVDLGLSNSCKSIQVKLTLSSADITNRSEDKLNISKENATDETSYVKSNTTFDIDLNDENGLKIKKENLCQDCKKIFNEYGILRKSFSDNVWLRKQEDTSEQVNDFATRIVEVDSKYKEYVLREFINKLKYLGPTTSSHNTRVMDKSKNPNNISHKDDIIKITPIEGKPCHLDTISIFSNNNNKVYTNKNIKSDRVLEKTQEELKNLIDLDILAFTEKFRLNITTTALHNLREELLVVFVTDLMSIKNLNKTIKDILLNKGFTQYQAVYLTKRLIDHWEEEFHPNNKRLKPSNIISDTFIVLPNVTGNHTKYEGSKNKTDCDIKTSQKEVDSDVHDYATKVSKEVAGWLLNLSISQAHNKVIQQAIIDELTHNIVGRHEYLIHNSFKNFNYASELENLKCQILKLKKWIGNIDNTLIDNANDLMERIQKIPVPKFSCSLKVNVIEPSNLGASSARRSSSPGKKINYKRNLNKVVPSKAIRAESNTLREHKSVYQAPTSTSPERKSFMNTRHNENRDTLQLLRKQFEFNETKTIAPCMQQKSSNTQQSNTGPTVNFSDKDIVENYFQYLKEWLEMIPISGNNSDEETEAKTARDGIYVAMREIFTNLRSEPNNDRFLCEDILEDEIEMLLSKLPQTPELASKKHILKSNVIKNTLDTIDFLKSSAPKSYKAQLIESVKNNLIDLTGNDDLNPDIFKLYEELQILNLAENFIICSYFKKENPVVSENYRKKLQKSAESFIEELKSNHSKELKNIDTKQYLDNIMHALKIVNLQSHETLRAEADDILLGLEIDKWISELPLVFSTDFAEYLNRRQLRNNIVKHIHDLENGKYTSGNVQDAKLVLICNEVSHFLDKVQLLEDAILNINLVVEDLMKRLNYRFRADEIENKKVGLHRPNFRENDMYTENSRSPNNIENQNRSLLNNKSIQAVSPNVQASEYYELPNYESFERGQPISSSPKNTLEPHWYTLQEDSHKISPAINPQIPNRIPQYVSMRPSPRNTLKPHWYHIPEDSQKIPPPNSSQIPNCIPQADPMRPSAGRTLEPHWYTIPEDSQKNSLPNRPQIPSRIVQVDPMRPSPRRNLEPHLYTIPNDSHRFSPANNSQNLRLPEFVPYPAYSDKVEYSHKGIENYRSPRQFSKEFVVPEQYIGKPDNNEYIVHRKPDVPLSMPSKRIAPNISLHPGSQNIDPARTVNNPTIEHRFQQSFLPADSSKSDWQNYSRNLRSDNAAIPRNVPQYSNHQQENNMRAPDMHTQNRSPGVQNIEDQRTPEMYGPNIFYKSTDQEGIQHIINSNSLERNMGQTNRDNDITSEHHEPFYPSSLIESPYISFRLPGRTGQYTTEGRNRAIDSDDDFDDDENLRCKCVEKIWRSRRRQKYCPLHENEEYPRCMTRPYYYPHFC